MWHEIFFPATAEDGSLVISHHKIDIKPGFSPNDILRRQAPCVITEQSYAQEIISVAKNQKEHGVIFDIQRRDDYSGCIVYADESRGTLSPQAVADLNSLARILPNPEQSSLHKLQLRALAALANAT